MLLQFAADSPEAFAVIPQVREWIDVVEVGTPLLKRFGLSAVSTAKALGGGKAVLADSKTMDGGGIEAAMLFQAGAQFVTVLACASEATIESAATEAERWDGYVLLDTLGHPDPASLLAQEHGPRIGYLLLHSGFDMIGAGTADTGMQTELLRSHRATPGSTRTAIAGGVTIDNIGLIAAESASLVIAGGSISGSDDPAATARDLRSRLVDAGTGWPWEPVLQPAGT